MPSARPGRWNQETPLMCYLGSLRPHQPRPPGRIIQLIQRNHRISATTLALIPEITRLVFVCKGRLQWRAALHTSDSRWYPLRNPYGANSCHNHTSFSGLEFRFRWFLLPVSHPLREVTDASTFQQVNQLFGKVGNVISSSLQRLRHEEYVDTLERTVTPAVFQL
jgi:hypothetical protein